MALSVRYLPGWPINPRSHPHRRGATPMLATSPPAVKFDVPPPPNSGLLPGDRSGLQRLLAPRRTAPAAADEQQPIHQVEETIFRDLLAMGRSLAPGVPGLSGDGDVGPTLTVPGDAPSEPPRVLPRLDGPRARPYLSIFGEVAIERVGYGDGPIEAAPLDARLAPAAAAVLVPVPAVAGGVRHRRRPCRGDQETPDDPGAGDPGQGLRGPQPRAGQRRGAVPEPVCRSPDTDRGGTDPGGDGRLQRGALGALGTAAARRRRRRPRP